MQNESSIRYILASQSPRRRELLEKLSIPFEVIPAKGKEFSDKKEPGDYAADLAFHKAYEVLERTKKEAQNGSDSRRTVIIGSDTIVVCGEEVLGKPSDEADAARMLRMLSGRTHQVYTGVALICAEAGREESSRFWEKTDVIFYELSEEEIAAYIASGDPMDKAGAYGIQGIFAPYVKAISGDYNTVVGFPLARVYHELKEKGYYSLPL